MWGFLLLPRACIVNEDDLFGLVEVGNISVFVDATAEIPRSRPISGTAADKIKKDVDIPNDLSPDFESWKPP